MLNIDSLEKGIVIDHIHAGSGMRIYSLLGLDTLDCSVAIIKNAKSSKYGKKDIIKIEGKTDLNLDILGVMDHNITINIIDMGRIVEKRSLELPKQVTNVIRCKNPRCISNAEEGVDHIFRLCNEELQQYRCIYCEQEFQK
ncbi:aspartate carbamoyltransferase regulatory subunit [Clostridium minihomine]|uniref:aspartate carbamoyltransferase regulatory subunit n=1 Tax=Clostridium minihomine TaxID=2045012 RepID=UPI000C758ED4|nr:aspartate carbamoyltransferase regulatory subunit [Clostridium minihomine]